MGIEDPICIVCKLAKGKPAPTSVESCKNEHIICDACVMSGNMTCPLCLTLYEFENKVTAGFGVTVKSIKIRNRFRPGQLPCAYMEGKDG
jgi:predicted aconitase with swiveling domain